MYTSAQGSRHDDRSHTHTGLGLSKGFSPVVEESLSVSWSPHRSCELLRRGDRGDPPLGRDRSVHRRCRGRECC